VSREVALSKDWVVFRVIDTGKGIPFEEQALLFSRFKPGSSRSASAETSHGLGLSICKLYTERMGGRIEVKSEPGAGSTFTVWLPAEVEADRFQRPAARPARRDGTRPLPKAGSSKVLIIEDDEYFRFLWRSSLEEVGYQTVVAKDGVKG